MPSKTVELTVGLFVAAGLAALFMLARKVSNLASFSNNEGYELVAYFENIGGLRMRSPVTMSGVVVGRVADIAYDDKRYQARVRLKIYPQYRLPADSSASIFTAGLLGEQYISVEPGGEERALKAGDEIGLTQSALVMEQLIAKFLFGKAAEGNQE